jgi:hypothetical protein
VTWDHVGFFIVRSREGKDFHLAKDGDEKPIAVYHTGEPPEEEEAAGAYVRGTHSLLAYLIMPQSDDPAHQRVRFLDVAQKRQGDFDVDVTISFELQKVAGKSLPPGLEIEVVNAGTGGIAHAEGGTEGKLIRGAIPSKDGRQTFLWRAKYPGWQDYRVQIWSASERTVLGSKVFETNPRCVLGVSTMHCEGD